MSISAKRIPFLLTVVGGILLSCHAAYLLYTNYDARQATLDGMLRQWEQRIEQQALTLGYFFSERYTDIIGLIQRNQFNEYFRFRQQGLAARFGLDATRNSISYQLSRYLEEKLVLSERIYSRIVFVDNQGILIADSQASGGITGERIDLSRLPLWSSAETWLTHESVDDGWQLVVSIPFFFEEEKTGQVLAWLNMPLLYRYLENVVAGEGEHQIFTGLLASFDSLQSLRDIGRIDPNLLLEPLRRVGNAQGRLIILEGKDGQSLDLQIYKATITSASMHLVAVLDRKLLPGLAESRRALLSMTVLTAFLLLIFAFLWVAYSRNLALAVRVEASEKGKLDLETKNRELQREMAERQQAEERNLELSEKLVQARKMEAVGLMASGVAHDLNNILSGVVSYPDLLLVQMKGNDGLRLPLEHIRDAGKRAAAVVADLLTIARGAAAIKEVINLNHLVEEYLQSPDFRSFSARYPAVQFLTRLDPDLHNSPCAPVHIRKCLMNLVINAAEAIHDTGSVTISTRNLILPEPSQGLPSGEYCVLEVGDSGPGIAAVDLAKIFEPFYSKKKLGRSGTGLGLTVVWNTVKSHGGEVVVDAGDSGTTFAIHLPSTREPLPDLEEERTAPLPVGKGETILVVDDEPIQRIIATEILSSLGYRVEQARSGEEALLLLQEMPVALLLLDMVMEPGLNGRQTYEQALQLRPGQKAIVATGYSGSAEINRIRALGVRQVIKKPYLVRELAIAVEQCLAGR